MHVLHLPGGSWIIDLPFRGVHWDPVATHGTGSTRSMSVQQRGSWGGALAAEVQMAVYRTTQLQVRLRLRCCGFATSLHGRA